MTTATIIFLKHENWTPCKKFSKKFEIRPIVDFLSTRCFVGSMSFDRMSIRRLVSYSALEKERERERNICNDLGFKILQ